MVTKANASLCVLAELWAAMRTRTETTVFKPLTVQGIIGNDESNVDSNFPIHKVGEYSKLEQILPFQLNKKWQ